MIDGNKLRAARKQQKLTQRKLAEACKVRQATINRLENGNINTTITIALRLAYALRCRVEDLTVS